MKLPRFVVRAMPRPVKRMYRFGADGRVAVRIDRRQG